jgi:O-antigen/teichoic acid export membrane protein
MPSSPDRPTEEDRPEHPSERESSPSVDYTERILKGSTSVFSGSMVGKVVGFVLQLVLARGFGQALFGLYSLGLTVLRLAQSVATLGLQNGIVRFAAPSYERDDTAHVKGTFLAAGGLGLAAGVAMGVGLFLSSSWLATAVFRNSDMAWVIAVFSCGLPFYVLTYLASRMARALSKMRVDVLLDSILQPALFLVFVGTLLALGQGFTAALYAFLASTVLAAGAGVYAIYRLFPPLLSRLPATYEIRPLLRFSLPIVGVTLASIGMTYADRLMLGMLSTVEAVGAYQAAASLSVQMRFVLFAVTAAFSPVISDLYHNDRLEALSRLYADTVRWILMTTLPAAILFVTFAPEIMSIWGPEFREGAPLLRILAVAYLIVAGVGSVGQMLQMSDHQDFVFVVNTSMAVLNLALNWVFIQWYGAVGAAVATGLTQALGNVVEIVGLQYFESIQPFRWALWKPAAATVATSGLAWLLSMHVPGSARWAVGIPVLLLAYGGLLVLLGLPERDRSILAALWTQATGRLRA